MRLAFDAGQEELRGEFSKVLADTSLRTLLDWLPQNAALDCKLWDQLAGLGWLGTAIAEQHGGSGLAEVMLCVQAEEIGRSMAAIPFVSSICGYGTGVSMAADAATQAALLPGIANGSAIGVVLTDDCWREAPQLAGTSRLSGVAGNVLDGWAATTALAFVNSAIVQIDLAEVSKEDLADSRLDLLHPSATLRFDATPVRVLASGGKATEQWQQILDRYALCVAFEQLGGAAAALEMARLHALNRYAFGRPVASFQALKHSFADLFVALDLARSNCLFGAAALNSRPELLHEAASVARLSATDAFRRCARGNMQMHGALGVTWESGCHLYYRRAQALAGHPGSLNSWREGLIAMLMARKQTAAHVPANHDAAPTLGDTPEQAQFRARAREWIKANAPWDALEQVKHLRHAGQPVSEQDWLALSRRWQKAKYDAGWACLVWPKEYGGAGLGPTENVIFQEEEGPFAELFGSFMIGQGFIAPTLMAYASPAQQAELLPPLASGAEIWCQLFSEPGAGSDLGGVRTRAEPTGDGHWRINGQKVWTSGAHYSKWGLAVLRTDPTVAKHKGLTVFMIRMDTPGVTVRPIRQLGGGSNFNEVFFDDVVVPDAWRVGPVNDGWRVALTTLMNERMTLGASIGIGFEEIFALASRAESSGKRPMDSDHVRLRLADWYAMDRAMHYGVYRSLAVLEAGGSPGPELSVGKLAGAVATQDIAAFGLDLLGEAGRAVADVGTDAWTMHTMFAFGAVHRVEGGTDEVLRNIIAERVLGLPQEYRADTGPFRDIPTGPS